MKRPILLAALLSATSLFSSNAYANTPVGSGNEAGTPTRMFIINAGQAGALTFSGSGTATFNNSVGETNQFNVGSSTNLGVNASLSSTPEFDAVAKSNLMLAGTTSLMQTNGTASSAANAQAASSSVASSSLQTSYDAANREFGSGWENESSKGANGRTFTTREAYETAKEEFRKEKYSETYETAMKSASSSSDSASQSGIISGSFVSTSVGTSTLAAQNATAYSAALDAATTTAANQKFGTTYNASSANGQTETEWNAAKTAYKTSLTSSLTESNTAGSSSNTASVDTSDVIVKGLGAIATVNTKDSSQFLVDLSRMQSVKQDNSTATANGSAASNLSTNSFATQSRQETASAFMQAFAGATPNMVTVDGTGAGKVYASTQVGSFNLGTGNTGTAEITPLTTVVSSPSN